MPENRIWFIPGLSRAARGQEQHSMPHVLHQWGPGTTRATHTLPPTALCVPLNFTTFAPAVTSPQAPPMLHFSLECAPCCTTHPASTAPCLSGSLGHWLPQHWRLHYAALHCTTIPLRQERGSQTEREPRVPSCFCSWAMEQQATRWEPVGYYLIPSGPQAACRSSIG